MPTTDFIEFGHTAHGITPLTARNIVTYLTATAFEKFLANRGLVSKAAGRSPRKIWFPPDGLLPKNKHSFSESGKRKSPVLFVGQLKKGNKVWHFGIQPSVDLHTHKGIIFSPKAVITRHYDSANGGKPIPIDDKKALKSLGWWNKELRQRLLGLADWLADSKDTISIPIGYQKLRLHSVPDSFSSSVSYREQSDSRLMRELLGDDE